MLHFASNTCIFEISLHHFDCPCKFSISQLLVKAANLIILLRNAPKCLSQPSQIAFFRFFVLDFCKISLLQYLHCVLYHLHERLHLFNRDLNAYLIDVNVSLVSQLKVVWRCLMNESFGSVANCKRLDDLSFHNFLEIDLSIKIFVVTEEWMEVNDVKSHRVHLIRGVLAC